MVGIPELTVMEQILIGAVMGMAAVVGYCFWTIQYILRWIREEKKHG